jgi:uncharacterized LabA/DUF88 family protein
MDLLGWKNKYKRYKFGISEDFGSILSLVDFGNVDYWYEYDERDENDVKLGTGEKLVVSIEKLHDFCGLFSLRAKFYYGLDHRKAKSIHLIRLARNFFGKTNAVTKHIQYIKHYLLDSEIQNNTRDVNYDLEGKYVYVKKCNFDVEICIDAIRLAGKYDTLCLFSSDADFVGLFRYLKGLGKKVILVKGGHAAGELKKQADLVINAQDIKGELTFKMQKSRR